MKVRNSILSRKSVGSRRRSCIEVVDAVARQMIMMILPLLFLPLLQLLSADEKIASSGRENVSRRREIGGRRCRRMANAVGRGRRSWRNWRRRGHEMQLGRRMQMMEVGIQFWWLLLLLLLLLGLRLLSLLKEWVMMMRRRMR